MQTDTRARSRYSHFRLAVTRHADGTEDRVWQAAEADEASIGEPTFHDLSEQELRALWLDGVIVTDDHITFPPFDL